MCIRDRQTITDLGKTANVIMDSQSARGIETTGNLKDVYKRQLCV